MATCSWSRSRSLLLALLVAGSSVAACGDSEESSVTGSAATSLALDETTAADGGATLDNCGSTLSFEEPPSRIVSYEQGLTELLLLLGLGDRVVGTAFTYGEPLAEVAREFVEITELNPDGPPSREVIVELAPDLIVSSYPDFDFDPAEGFASRDDVEAFGGQVFGWTANCTTRPAEVTIETVYDDIEALGTLLGVPERAVELVAQMRADVTAVQAVVADRESPTVLVYANGDGPLGVSGSGLPTDLVELAGGTNVFSDLGSSFDRVPVEEAAIRAPEVFATIDYEPGPTPDEKLATLTALLPNSSAAVEQRSFPISDVALNPGVRNAEAVRLIAEGLFGDLGLDG